MKEFFSAQNVCMNIENWTPWTFTYVLYDGSAFGWFISLVTNIYIFIVIVMFYLAIAHPKKKSRPTLLLISIIASFNINKLLKNLIQQERPSGTAINRSYGMPSDHAQLMALLAMFWYSLLTDNQRFAFNPITQAQNRKTILFLYVVALVVTYSRFYLCLHTFNQLVVGFIIGSFLGKLVYFVDKTLIKDEYFDVKDSILL
eukprot:94547_1